MNPSYNNGNGSNVGGQTGQPGGIFSRNESTGGTTGASGAAGVPGAKPGVIASGPDPADMPDEKPAGLSLGSNRHLFRRPRAQAPRNFVMNVGGGAGAGMGAGRKSGGPKKGLIIGGLAVVVILIMALVVGMMLSQNRNGNNNGSGGSQNNTIVEPSDSTNTEETEEPEEIYTGVNEDFYRYANYILNGTNESKTLPSYNENKEYAVMTAVESRNNKYFQIADNLWSTFYNRISKDSTKFVEGSKLYELVGNQNLLMDFFTKYTGSKDWTEDEMWVSYRKNGLDSTIQTVRADYEKIAKTSYEAGANWAKLKADWNVAALKLYDAYDAKGCVKENDFDQECINNNLDNFARVIVDFKEADSQLENLNVDINVLLETLIKNCFDIKGNLDETEK